MADWILRRAEPNDADALANCIDAAYGAYAERISDLPAVSADCAGEITRHQVWVAEIGDRIAGGLVLIPEADFMLLANVAVHPVHTGAGLGRALIALAESESADQGFREMRLTTHVDMPENVRLYAHLGWEMGQTRGNKVSMKKAI